LKGGREDGREGGKEGGEGGLGVRHQRKETACARLRKIKGLQAVRLEAGSDW
jgi:hypothetical protein